MCKQWYSCQYALTDADTSHCSQGNTRNIKESALKTDSGRKVPCCTRGSNWRHHCAWPFGQLSYSTPLKTNNNNNNKRKTFLSLLNTSCISAINISKSINFTYFSQTHLHEYKLYVVQQCTLLFQYISRCSAMPPIITAT